MDKIAYCGLHCSHCPYPQCPGCRSDNPFCSFATLFADNKCPNVTCCLARGLDGCYECSQLADCRIGFYGTTEQFAKATALFIQKHGKQQYDVTLTHAIQSDESFSSQFNHMESVGMMVEFLEKYIK